MNCPNNGVLTNSFFFKPLLLLNYWQNKLNAVNNGAFSVSPHFVLINGEACYELNEIYWRDSAKIQFNAQETYIRKYDFLPVNVVYTTNYKQGGVFYSEYNLRDVHINTPVPILESTIGVDLRLYKRYKRVNAAGSKNRGCDVHVKHKAPYWQAITLTDDTLSLKKLKGKILIMAFLDTTHFTDNFFTPILERLQKEYSEDVTVLGVMSKNKNYIHAVTSKMPSYKVLCNAEDIITAYNYISNTHLLVIDKKGKVRCIITCFTEYYAEKQLNNFIQSLK